MSSVSGRRKALRRLCVIAVDIRSLHNVGSLFRTCDGLRAELVLVGVSPTPRRTKDQRLPHVVNKAEKSIAKTALGAEKTVPWQWFSQLSDAVAYARQEGFVVYAIEQSPHAELLSTLQVTQPTALVVGREVEGLSQGELALCDGVFEIPMYGQKESFNVTVAAAMALYQCRIS